LVLQIQPIDWALMTTIWKIVSQVDEKNICAYNIYVEITLGQPIKFFKTYFRTGGNNG